MSYFFVRYVGKLVGRYYDSQGNPTKYLKGVEAKARRGAQLLEKQKIEEAKIPSCNSRWSEQDGGKVVFLFQIHVKLWSFVKYCILFLYNFQVLEGFMTCIFLMQFEHMIPCGCYRYILNPYPSDSLNYFILYYRVYLSILQPCSLGRAYINLDHSSPQIVWDPTFLLNKLSLTFWKYPNGLINASSCFLRQIWRASPIN